MSDYRDPMLCCRNFLALAYDAAQTRRWAEAIELAREAERQALLFREALELAQKAAGMPRQGSGNGLEGVCVGPATIREGWRGEYPCNP